MALANRYPHPWRVAPYVGALATWAYNNPNLWVPEAKAAGRAAFNAVRDAAASGTSNTRMSTKRYRARTVPYGRTVLSGGPRTGGRIRKSPFTGYPAFGRPDQELKVNDEVGSAAQTAGTHGLTNATFNLLNGVAQGTSERQRIGNSIYMKKLDIECSVNWIGGTLAGTATSKSMSFHVAIIMDYQCNGATPAGTDVYDEFIVGGVVDMVKRNLEHTSRFKILRHKKWMVTPDFEVNGTSLEVKGGSRSVYWSIPLGRERTRYDGTNSTVSDISDVAVWAMFWSEFDGTSSFLQPSVLNMDFFSRLRYHG